MKASDCDCVILCGGLGKRLRKAVEDVPKVLAEVNGRPFLDLIIGHLEVQGITRVILCTGHQAKAVEERYYARSSGLTIEFSRELEPLGTGGAVKNARAMITSDPFIVLNGDSFLEADLEALLDFHSEKAAVASIIAAEVRDGSDFGNIRLDDNSRVIEFQEKTSDGSRQLVNAGVYCFGGDIFSFMPPEKRFSLEFDLFPSLAGKPFFALVTEQEFTDIGTPERYKSAREKLK